MPSKGLGAPKARPLERTILFCMFASGGSEQALGFLFTVDWAHWPPSCTVFDLAFHVGLDGIYRALVDPDGSERILSGPGES